MGVFTPLEATIGGATLGVATAAHMAVNGRILGHSGIIKGALIGDRAIWRPVFLAGMAAGSVAALNLVPGAFPPLPETFTVGRAALAGALVGLGSALGNGCTSGHGICGLSRLSIRSAAYVATFMVSGAAAATMSGITSALGVSGIATPLQPVIPDMPVITQGLTMVGGALVSAFALWYAGMRSGEGRKWIVNLTAEAVTGAFFALGLAFAGMTKSSKVGSFLAITDSCWDPSLMFVMCGGILMTMPVFQAIIHKKILPDKPPCAPSYMMPTSSVIDAKLIAGGVLFGAGWGIGGMCPGPAVANIFANPLCQINQVFMLAMIAGMLLERTSMVQQVFESPKTKSV